MSHFTMGVIIPKDQIEENMEEVVGQQIAEYDENLEVEEYGKVCYCLDSQAQSLAIKAVEKETGKTVDDFRDEIKNITDWDESNKKWEELTGDYFAREKELKEEFSAQVSPDLECENCGGSGVYLTTYNPKSKWDWFSIGGRWSGMLDDYDPSKDPDNIGKCNICYGTGMRDDNLGRTAREKDPNYTCNSCNGTGEVVKYPTQWKKYSGDIAPVQKVVDLLNSKSGLYGYVTPEKEWIERGKMGWWGIATDEKDKDVWVEEQKNILEKYNDGSYVVDCHI